MLFSPSDERWPAPEMSARAGGHSQAAFYSLRHVCQRVGISEASLWRMRQSGDFPQPLKIHGRKIAWPAEVVEAWIRERIEAAERGA